MRRTYRPVGKPRTVSLLDAARALGIGPGVAYRLARRDGQLCAGLPVVRVGERWRVAVAALDRVLDPPTDRAA